MRVAIASDHAGVGLEQPTVDAVRAAGHEPVVVGAPVEGDDYPDVAEAVAGALREGRAERGVVLCGSGAGVTVAANKIPLVRAALAYDTYTARQMVEHDAVNVLALGARVIGPAIAHDVVTAFISAAFSGAERHARRLGKVIELEATRIAGAGHDLRDRDQRLWVRGVTFDAIDDARVAQWIGDHGVSGVVADPRRLAATLRTAPVVAQRLLDEHGHATEWRTAASTDELVTSVLLAELLPVAELLGAIHAARRGGDGYVVATLPPALHDDVGGVVAAAQQVLADAGRPNVMIDVPATRAGLGAATRLITQGVPVHLSMLFSVEHHRAALDAVAAGIEQRLDAGADPRVGAVASVEVAQWDRATAERLPEALRDTVGLAVARTVADEHRVSLESARWLDLLDAGALAPRLLFSAAAPDERAEEPATWYVAGIDAAGAGMLLDVETLEATIATDAVPTRSLDADAAADTLARAQDAGITIEVLATRLRHDALQRRGEAWAALAGEVARAVGDDVVSPVPSDPA